MSYQLSALVAFLFYLFVSVADVSAAIMVIAPHPDDEALMFSGIIHSALQRGEEVKVVVVTNGDFNGIQQGYTRQGETVSAMVGILGMKESDIIFLGYPDAGLKTIYDSFTAVNSAFTSRAGQTQTYGRRGLGNIDYHSYLYGTPGKYNRVNMLMDLKAVVTAYRPQHIFLPNQYDTHSDHATTYNLVRNALLDLAAVEPDYQPVIHHTLIHGGSEAVWPTQAGPDPSAVFSAPPNLATTPLKWNNRETLFVPLVMQTKQLTQNLKHLAITSYVSEVDPYMRSFVHKDEFFWAENLYSTNIPPVANAGVDRVAPAGTMVSLDGSGSQDQNSDSLSYTWKQVQGPTVQIINPAGATPSFMAPGEAAQLVFQLVVSDGKISSYPATTSVTLTAPVISNVWPDPWIKQDVGTVGVAGDTAFTNGLFTLKGSGNDIWDRADAFHYTYQPLNGDGQIIARITSLQDTNSWAKAGVMIRASLAANAPHAFMAITAGNGAAFQRRLSAGAASLHTAGLKIKAPYWVKLVRSGNRFTGYISQDGLSWVSTGSDTITMAGPVLIGMAVTSHNNGTLCSTAMDEVTVAAAVTPPSVVLTSPTTGAAFTAPATINMTATANGGTAATVARVEFYAGTTLLGSDTAAPFTVAWTDAIAGDYSLTAKVIDSLGATAVSAPVTISVGKQNVLPDPWVRQDIGRTALAGAASFANDTFTVSGSGNDIWDRVDAFSYVYQPLEGDGQIIARVASMLDTNAWAKAGVMIRASLAANSPHAFMAVTPRSGSTFQRRTVSDGYSSHTAGPKVTAPYWMKLVRSGNTFTGYTSTDGITWIQVGSSSSISMGSSVLVGLAVTSHDNTVLSTANFNGVSLAAHQ